MLGSHTITKLKFTMMRQYRTNITILHCQNDLRQCHTNIEIFNCQNDKTQYRANSGHTCTGKTLDTANVVPAYDVANYCIDK